MYTYNIGDDYETIKKDTERNRNNSLDNNVAIMRVVFIQCSGSGFRRLK